MHGVLEELEEPVLKARVLQALMEKLQPQGGYVPIEAEHPLYRAAVKGLWVVGVRLERVEGKAKLAQNRTPAQRRELLEKLWGRGNAEDPRTIELIRAANPDTPTPGFLEGPEGVRLHCWLGPEAVELLKDAYWNDKMVRLRPEMEK